MNLGVAQIQWQNGSRATPLHSLPRSFISRNSQHQHSAEPTDNGSVAPRIFQAPHLAQRRERDATRQSYGRSHRPAGHAALPPQALLPAERDARRARVPADARARATAPADLHVARRDAARAGAAGGRRAAQAVPRARPAARAASSASSTPTRRRRAAAGPSAPASSPATWAAWWWVTTARPRPRAPSPTTSSRPATTFRSASSRRWPTARSRRRRRPRRPRRRRSAGPRYAGAVGRGSTTGNTGRGVGWTRRGTRTASKAAGTGGARRGGGSAAGTAATTLAGCRAASGVAGSRCPRRAAEGATAAVEEEEEEGQEEASPDEGGAEEAGKCGGILGKPRRMRRELHLSSAGVMARKHQPVVPRTRRAEKRRFNLHLAIHCINST